MGGATDTRDTSDSDNRHVLFIERLFPFSQRERPVHRVFIVLISLILLLGFAGLFGDGALSNRVANTGDFEVEYQRFMRVEFPVEIVLSLKQVDEEVDIYLNSDFLDKVEITHVTPFPKEVSVSGDHIIYTIRSGGSGPVIFYLLPRRAGFQSLEIGINGSKSTFNQLIYF